MIEFLLLIVTPFAVLPGGAPIALCCWGLLAGVLYLIRQTPANRKDY